MWRYDARKKNAVEIESATRFAGIPADVDAAFIDNATEDLYVAKGNSSRLILKNNVAVSPKVRAKLK